MLAISRKSVPVWLLITSARVALPGVACLFGEPIDSRDARNEEAQESEIGSNDRDEAHIRGQLHRVMTNKLQGVQLSTWPFLC